VIHFPSVVCTNSPSTTTRLEPPLLAGRLPELNWPFRVNWAVNQRILSTHIRSAATSATAFSTEGVPLRRLVGLVGECGLLGLHPDAKDTS
jgi:hypothetical protein